MVAHEPSVRGLERKAIAGAPLILQRTDDDFISAMLEQLRSPDGFEKVLSYEANTRDKHQTLRLFQPVHRTFHVAVVEALCQQAGHPRLDSLKIESAGMVIRRVKCSRAPLASTAAPQGWLSIGRHLRGWLPLEDAERDPDPARRRNPTGGHPAIVAALSTKTRLVDAVEQVTPLFVAPPEVCEAAHRTILYGILQTASSELSASPAPAISPNDFGNSDPETRRGQNDDPFADSIPRFLQSGRAVVDFVNLANREFSGASAAAGKYLREDGKQVSLATQASKLLLRDFINFLRFLRMSIDAFSGSPNSEALLNLLGELQIPYTEDELRNGTGRSAKDVVLVATNALVGEVPNQTATTFTMPLRWPQISTELGRRLYAQIKHCLAANLSIAQPGVTRFDDPNALYQVRAFIRVKQNTCCPPQLCWTEPSEPFTIVPWFEAGAVPPIQIELPNITSQTVKALKPNVTFKIPKQLFNFLNDLDPKGLIEGKGKEGSSIGLDWICGFNISIIFLVAFIVMFMFLILLNIVFWWLPFIKICFPIPSFLSRKE